MTFELGGKRLGLPALDVVELVRAVEISAVPGGPAILEGVINYRGAVVPVLDVRARFQVPARPLSADQHMVVARAGPRTVALRVDRVLELLQPAPGSVTDAHEAVPEAELAAGVLLLEEGIVVIHDLERFLSTEEAIAVDRAVESMEAGAEGGDGARAARASTLEP